MRSILLAGILAGCCFALPAQAQDYTLEAAAELPADLPAELAAKLSPAGHKVKGPRRDLCEIWLVKELAVKEGFSPTLAVKYPFTPGQLIGIVSVPRRAGLVDFKGHEIEDGVYTLRYGQQPMDGNHIGTSETSDFLLAVPVADDADPEPIASQDDLFDKSAAASGTTHPAIFSLLSAGDAEITEAGLVHDEPNEFWILQLPGAGAGDVKVPIRLVIVGESKG
jgi:hypothetical protein